MTRSGPSSSRSGFCSASGACSGLAVAPTIDVLNVFLLLLSLFGKQE
jgi:hypothetical protein